MWQFQQQLLCALNEIHEGLDKTRVKVWNFYYESYKFDDVNVTQKYMWDKFGVILGYFASEQMICRN